MLTMQKGKLTELWLLEKKKLQAQTHKLIFIFQLVCFEFFMYLYAYLRFHVVSKLGDILAWNMQVEFPLIC